MLVATLTRTALLPSPLGELTRLAEILSEERPFRAATWSAAAVMESVLAVVL